MVPHDVPSSRADAARSTGSWDPYEIWLTRVKLPRERQPGRAAVAAARIEAVAAPSGPESHPDEALLLPHAS